jgi:hypothetical protein
MMTPTWRCKSGCIGFEYSLEPLKGELASTQIRRVATQLVAALAPLAVVTNNDFGTVLLGECVGEFSGSEAGQLLVSALKTVSDVSDFQIECSLLCRDENLQTFAIDPGMSIRIERADKSDSGNHSPLELYLSLDTDVFVSVTDVDRDNRKIAQINAPVFNKFLQQLKMAGGALRRIDSDYFNYLPELITAEGFVVPGIPMS